MFLKSITIQGFKSFAKRVNLDLSSSVTGVVGPNGSGKSNVAEAIRFVLGEQSMKGLRSKSGSDLIFKGSPRLSSLSRASVSLILDNSNKKIDNKLFNNLEESNSILNNFLAMDEIILTREIYSDGASEYLINGTKVRLKDVQELLAMANISASGHTIVNQGEADRILLSNNIERREMIEDALGLRIYHIRIKEGVRKLEKVSEHLKEIESNRRENLPHLNYLRKQVKELEKREDEINQVSDLLKIYLGKEDIDITEKKKIINDYNIENNIATEEEKLHTLLRSKKFQEESENNQDQNNNPLLSNLKNEINNLKDKLRDLNLDKDNLYKEKINLDLEIKFLVRKDLENTRETNPFIESNLNKYIINKSDLIEFEDNRKILWENIFKLNQEKNYLELTNNLEKANYGEKDFIKRIKGDTKENNSEIKEEIQEEKDNSQEHIELLKKDLESKENNLLEVGKSIQEIETKLSIKNSELQKLETESKEHTYKLDNEILQLKLNLEKLYSQRETHNLKRVELEKEESDFNNLLGEMSVLLGQKSLKYKNFNLNELSEEEKSISQLPQSELRRKIERSKIRIEESGVLNAGEVLDEYESLNERDEFLTKEIADLEHSKSNLENLIIDLKNTLLSDFNTGLNQINQNFNNYFAEVFPGGKANLAIEKNIIKNKTDEKGLEVESEHEGEPGVDIQINLPQKKVKDLQMLSGGERALSSIALIFAMSSINHPPFMVLDETDAALDEANARKYGQMIKKLAERSKLLVITHNRETMNQCDVLYGVTVGAEGCSKLLSIKFAEATEYAK